MTATLAKCPMPVYDGCMFPMFPPLLPNPDKHMEAIRDFESRDTDILICTFPKTGTNWIYEIISMLVQGHPTYVKSIKMESMLETFDLTTAAEMTSPRILSTHVPFRFLPKQHLAKGCKIVHVLRNPKDVLVSFYGHIKLDSRGRHTCALGEHEFPGTWDHYLRDSIENRHNVYDGVLKYEKDWEAAKRSKAVTNIHTMYYEDLQKDPVAEITRLAKYLEVSTDEGLIKDIADKCSFQKLRNAMATVKTGPIKVVQDGNTLLFRKGVVGDWQNWFTLAQNEEFDKLLDKELGGTSIQYKYTI